VKKPITLFTWGYDGWGNATDKLLKAVDAVEVSRGFDPPIFVDTRIRRSVRAAGFVGSKFEKKLGSDRHRWMKSLGNKFILTRTGPAIQIAQPAAAIDLLDLAISSAEENRRVIFSCSCPRPRWKGGRCHRTEIADLVLKAAKKGKIPVQISEWPGSEPQRVHLEVKPAVFKAVRGGRMTIPLKNPIDLPQMAGLSGCSIATLHSGDDEIHRVVGPVIWQQGKWALPVLSWFYDPDASIAEYRTKARQLRKEWGFGPVNS
jgi:hypothetical protein